MNMIDELAKAICCPDGCNSKELGACVSDFSEHQARSVLRVLRNATPGMVYAGADASSKFGDMTYREARKVFRAMIDAALGEKA